MGKTDKKNAAKSNKPSETSTSPIEAPEATFANPWDDESWRRPEIVDPKLVWKALEANGLPTDDKESDRANRLASFYVHENAQKKMKLVRCVPNDESDPQGCGFMSDELLESCPFCGSGAPIVALPKEAPKADKDIELTVTAAEKKADDKKNEKVARVTSKNLKDKKKERGEVVDEKSKEPANEPSKTNVSADAAMVPDKSEVLANDLPTESAGGTAGDLDRIANRIDEIHEEMLRHNAFSAWEMGRLLAEIRDKKLWSTVRREDGSYDFSSFNSYVAQRFDFTPDYTMLMIRVSSSMTEKQAEIGIAKAKYILDAKLPDDMTTELFAYAAERDAKGGWKHSAIELRLKIKNLKNPQLPASTNPSSDPPTSDSDDDTDRDDDDTDEDEDDDDPKTSGSPTGTTTKPVTKQVQMVSVSFEKKEFNLPLVIKGSQVKPAKKIQDEPHGTLQVPGGVKIHFKLVIVEDGQISIEGRIETPY